MRRSFIRLLILAAAVGLLLFLFLRPTSVPERSASSKEPVTTVESAAMPKPAASLTTDRFRARADSASSTAADGEPEHAPRLSWGTRFKYQDFDNWSDFQDHVFAAVIAMPFDELSAQAESGDGEAAYAMSVLLHACIRWAPSSEKEVSLREETYVDLMVEDIEREESWYEGALVRSRFLFELCRDRERETLHAEVLDWIMRSADLGYQPGALSYIVQGDQLAGQAAIRGDARHIANYRARAPVYLERLLRSGETEAFLLAGMLAGSGWIAPPDPILGYGYLRAAQLIDVEDPYAERHLTELALKLDDSELLEARKLGREICEHYVPRECGG